MMNKILTILLLIFCMTIFKVNAQIYKTDSTINERHTADLLLKKSKKQKTTAWILLGAGAGVSIAGYIIGENSYGSNPSDLFGITSPRAQTGSAMILTGGTAMVASVPFFIASGRKRKKANLILKNESQSFFRPLNYNITILSVGVNWKL